MITIWETASAGLLLSCSDAHQEHPRSPTRDTAQDSWTRAKRGSRARIPSFALVSVFLKFIASTTHSHHCCLPQRLLQSIKSGRVRSLQLEFNLASGACNAVSCHVMTAITVRLPCTLMITARRTAPDHPQPESGCHNCIEVIMSFSATGGTDRSRSQVPKEA